MSATARLAPLSASLLARPYVSVLFDHEPATLSGDPPDSVTDLNLDQLVDSVLVGRAEYDLAGIFDQRLVDADEVAYRQAVLRDLERPDVAEAVTRFAERMRTMRSQLAQSASLRYPVQRQMWLLAAADSYRVAVTSLGEDLDSVCCDSAALGSLRRYLAGYRAEPTFADLERDAAEVATALDKVRYRLQIHGDRVQVSRAVDDENDYAADVAATFERFRQAPTASYRIKLSHYPDEPCRGGNRGPGRIVVPAAVRRPRPVLHPTRRLRR